MNLNRLLIDINDFLMSSAKKNSVPRKRNLCTAEEYRALFQIQILDYSTRFSLKFQVFFTQRKLQLAPVLFIIHIYLQILLQRNQTTCTILVCNLTIFP